MHSLISWTPGLLPLLMAFAVGVPLAAPAAAEAAVLVVLAPGAYKAALDGIVPVYEKSSGNMIALHTRRPR